MNYLFIYLYVIDISQRVLRNILSYHRDTLGATLLGASKQQESAESSSEDILDGVGDDFTNIQVKVHDSNAKSNNLQEEIYRLLSYQTELKKSLNKAFAERDQHKSLAVELESRVLELKHELQRLQTKCKSYKDVEHHLRKQLEEIDLHVLENGNEKQKYELEVSSQAKELYHLKELCRKYTEEQEQLKKMIHLKELDVQLLKQQQMEVSGQEEGSLAMKQELESLKNKYENEKEELFETTTILKSQCAELQKRLNFAQQDVAKRDNELRMLTEKYVDDMKKVNEECERWKSLYNSKAEELAVLEIEYSRFKEKRSKESVELQKAETNLEEARCQCKELEKDIKQVETESAKKIQNAQAEIQELRQELEEGSSKIKFFENNSSQQNNIIHESLQSLLSSKVETETKERYLKDELEKLARTKVELEDTVDHLQSKLKRQEEKFQDEIKNACVAAKEESSHFKRTLEDQNYHLERKVHSLQIDLENSSEKQESLLKEIERLKNELEKVAQQYHEQRSNVTALTEIQKRLEVERSDLRLQLEKARSDAKEKVVQEAELVLKAQNLEEALYNAELNIKELTNQPHTSHDPGEIERLKEQLMSAQVDVIRLQEMVRFKDEKITMLETRLAELVKERDVCHKRLDDLQLRYQDVVVEAQAERHKKETLQEKVSYLQEQVETEVQAKDNLRSVIFSLENGRMPISGHRMVLTENVPATSTPPHQSVYETGDLGKQLEAEKELSRKYKETAKKLHSELQSIKKKLDEKKKQKTDDNQKTVSPQIESFDLLALETVLQKNSDLRLELKQEKDKCVTAEEKLQNMKKEMELMALRREEVMTAERISLQTNNKLDHHLSELQQKLQNEYVSRSELRQLKREHDAAISLVQEEVQQRAQLELRERMNRIHGLLEAQMQEKIKLERLHLETEEKLRHGTCEIRSELMMELAKLQSSLKAQEARETNFFNTVESLMRSKGEIRSRKKSVPFKTVSLPANARNLHTPPVRDISLSSTSRLPSFFSATPVVTKEYAQPVPRNSTQGLSNSNINSGLTNALRQELQDSIRKHVGTAPNSLNSTIAELEKDLSSKLQANKIADDGYEVWKKAFLL